MRFITIYRMEKDGVGPFRASGELTGQDLGPYQDYAKSLLAYLENAGPALDLKEPDADGLDNLSWIYTFGCKSLETLRAWFPLDLRKAQQLGFKVVARKVPFGDFRLSHSGNQIAFVISENSPITETIDLDTFSKTTPHPLDWKR